MKTRRRKQTKLTKQSKDTKPAKQTQEDFARAAGYKLRRSRWQLTEKVLRDCFDEDAVKSRRFLGALSECCEQTTLSFEEALDQIAAHRAVRQTGYGAGRGQSHTKNWTPKDVDLVTSEFAAQSAIEQSGDESGVGRSDLDESYSDLPTVSRNSTGRKRRTQAAPNNPSLLLKTPEDSETTIRLQRPRPSPCLRRPPIVNWRSRLRQNREQEAADKDGDQDEEEEEESEEEDESEDEEEEEESEEEDESEDEEEEEVIEDNEEEEEELIEDVEEDKESGDDTGEEQSGGEIGGQKEGITGEEGNLIDTNEKGPAPGSFMNSTRRKRKRQSPAVEQGRSTRARLSNVPSDSVVGDQTSSVSNEPPETADLGGNFDEFSFNDDNEDGPSHFSADIVRTSNGTCEEATRSTAANFLDNNCDSNSNNEGTHQSQLSIGVARTNIETSGKPTRAGAADVGNAVDNREMVRKAQAAAEDLPSAQSTIFAQIKALRQRHEDVVTSFSQFCADKRVVLQEKRSALDKCRIICTDAEKRLQLTSDTILQKQKDSQGLHNITYNTDSGLAGCSTELLENVRTKLEPLMALMKLVDDDLQKLRERGQVLKDELNASEMARDSALKAIAYAERDEEAGRKRLQEALNEMQSFSDDLLSSAQGVSGWVAVAMDASVALDASSSSIP